MSFWTRVGVAISDLGVFKMSCEQHDVEYTLCEDKNFKMQGYQVHAFLIDRQSRGGRQGYLVEDGGNFKVMLDSDARYSSISRRIGTKLTRDYTKGVIVKDVRRSGKMVDWEREQADGSLMLKVSSL